jgi:hypothetical protein
MYERGCRCHNLKLSVEGYMPYKDRNKRSALIAPPQLECPGLSTNGIPSTGANDRDTTDRHMIPHPGWHVAANDIVVLSASRLGVRRMDLLAD